MLKGFGVRFCLCKLIGLIGLLPNLAFAICVEAFQTRLRSEPSANARVTWVVGRYMPLLETERRGGWVKVVDVDGETHWAAAQDLTNSIRCVVIRTRSAALRKGPGTQHPITDLQVAEKYTAFKRLEPEDDRPEHENWYWVEDETGQRAWVAVATAWRATSVNRIGF